MTLLDTTQMASVDESFLLWLRVKGIPTIQSVYNL